MHCGGDLIDSPLLLISGLTRERGMNSVDVLIWIVLLLFAAKGFMKGLVREVCSFAGIFLGGWTAFACHRSLAEVLSSRINLPAAVIPFLSFALIFVGLGLLFILLGHLLTAVFRMVFLGGVNRIGGVLLGLAQGALVLCLVLPLACDKRLPLNVTATIASSRAARPFLVCGKGIFSCWRSGGGLLEPGNTLRKGHAPENPRGI